MIDSREPRKPVPGGSTVRVQKTLTSAEELLRLSETGRYELVRGDLIKLPPASLAHGGTQSNADFLIQRHVREHRLGRVFAGELGVWLERDPDTVRAADVAFYARGRLPEGALPVEFASIVPDLVVEVVATDDAAGAIQSRIEDWLRAGVRLLWVAYVATRSVVEYRSLREIRVLTGDDMLDGGDVLPGFLVPISELFT